MKTTKRATTGHPVHELIAARWSPYAYEPRSVSEEDVAAIFEAARWAPSSYNEQPWRYIIAKREDAAEFERLLSCLVEANRAWAKNASVLALGVASDSFSRNGKTNRHAMHDVGLASANLTFEANARGLLVHQMAGILPDEARKLYGIPDGFDAVTALAIGHAAKEDSNVDAELLERDRGPRSRRPLDETVFSGAWGKPADLGGA